MRPFRRGRRGLRRIICPDGDDARPGVEGFDFAGDKAIAVAERVEGRRGEEKKKDRPSTQRLVLDRQASSWRNAAPISVAPYASRRLASSAPVDSEPCHTTDVGRNVEFYHFPRPKLTPGPRSPLNDPRAKRGTTVSRARGYRRALESSFHDVVVLSLARFLSRGKISRGKFKGENRETGISWVRAARRRHGRRERETPSPIFAFPSSQINIQIGFAHSQRIRSFESLVRAASRSFI